VKHKRYFVRQGAILKAQDSHACVTRKRTGGACMHVEDGSTMCGRVHAGSTLTRLSMEDARHDTNLVKQRHSMKVGLTRDRIKFHRVRKNKDRVGRGE
jgi:hypothetical protein